MRNCPNCNTPIDPYECKYKYCGTYYYDVKRRIITVVGRKTNREIVESLRRFSKEELIAFLKGNLGD